MCQDASPWMCLGKGFPPHPFHFFVDKILGLLRKVATLCAWPSPAALNLSSHVKTLDVTLLFGCISCNCWCLVASLGCPEGRSAVKCDSPLWWEGRVGKRNGRSLTRADKIVQQTPPPPIQKSGVRAGLLRVTFLRNQTPSALYSGSRGRRGSDFTTGAVFLMCGVHRLSNPSLRHYLDISGQKLFTTW